MRNKKEPTYLSRNYLESSNALERREYSAEAGITKVVHTIERLLTSQSYVCVGVSGSDTNVGKTYISGRIGRAIHERNIPLRECNTIESMDRFILDGRETSVLLFFSLPAALDGESREFQNQALKKHSENLGLPLLQFDVRVFIYRPDKPFYMSVKLESNDIVINNTEARDKK